MCVNCIFYDEGVPQNRICAVVAAPQQKHQELVPVITTIVGCTMAISVGIFLLYKRLSLHSF